MTVPMEPSDEEKVLQVVQEMLSRRGIPFAPETRINGEDAIDHGDAEDLIIQSLHRIGVRPWDWAHRFPYDRFFRPESEITFGAPLFIGHSALRLLAFAMDPFGLSRWIARHDPLRIGRVFAWLGRRGGRQDAAVADIGKPPLTAQDFVALILGIKAEARHRADDRRP